MQVDQVNALKPGHIQRWLAASIQKINIKEEQTSAMRQKQN